MQHYIIVKWNNNANKKELSDSARRLYANASAACGVKRVDIKDNVTDRDNRYDLMIILHMNKADLLMWDNSDLHKKWKADFGAFIDKKCIFDCE